MSILGAVRHYTKRLERRFSKRKTARKQFNTTLDRRLILKIKILGQYLMIPLYPLTEHLLELGIEEVVTFIEDGALKEDLQRHLLQDHLLVTELRPSKTVSRKVLRLKNAMALLELLEIYTSPEAQKEVIERLMGEVGDKE